MDWSWLSEQVVNAVTWLLIVVFVVAPALRIHASTVLWKVYKHEKEIGLPTGTTLERFIIASTGSVASVILGFFGLLRAGFLLGLTDFEVQQPWGIIATGLALILLVIPAFIWEGMYWSGRLER